MPQEDAQRWNARYAQKLSEEREYVPKPFLFDNAAFLPSKGLALDIATGLGGNAQFLMAAGLRVIAVDISEVGIRASKARCPDILGVVADLTRFNLPESTFDVILNFFYLQRDLWPEIVRSLRPGGLLFFETMTERMLADNPDINQNHLLASGELSSAFPTLETIVYEEFCAEEDSRITLATDRLLARKR